MIIQGSPDILHGPTGLMNSTINTMLAGLDRPPAEIAAEINQNWRNANPDLVTLFKASGTSTDIFSPTDQYIIDASIEEEKQELLAKQRADIEIALEKQRQLNTKLANAKDDINQQKIVNAEIKNLIENTIQPKLINLGQKTIDYIESHQGVLTDVQVDNLVMSTARNITAVIENQDATIKYMDAVTTYAGSVKSEENAATVSAAFNEVDRTAKNSFNTADVVQVAIADVGKSVKTAAIAAGVDLTKQVLTKVDNKTVKTAIVADKIVFDPGQSAVTPILLAVAAAYFLGA
jgi:hypothetical protein